MKRRVTVLLWTIGLICFGSLIAWYTSKYPVPVLQPKGQIGAQEHNLIIFTVLISIAVVIPVFAMLAVISWKYREGNHKAKYTPELDGSRAAETIWWVIPTTIMILISVVTWQSSYALDPFKSLQSSNQTLRVQVVALDWKWLFIYPDYQIASINEVAIPTDTPVNFTITSDTVMSSFWVPQLGGQMYAMPGMSTQLHLDATEVGTYNGSAANISGKGFAGMKFKLLAKSSADFTAWTQSVKESPYVVDTAQFNQLTRPTTNNKVEYFGSVSDGLYDTIIMKHMMPENTKNHTGHSLTGETN